MAKTISPINYKEYPECMFAMIAAYLPGDEGDDLRRVAGKVVFRHEDQDGNTYKNGLLHSYDDKPAREGDLPAVLIRDHQAWYKYGKRHREGDVPVVISGYHESWYKDGELHREGDKPALISGNKKEWYLNGRRYR